MKLALLFKLMLIRIFNNKNLFKQRRGKFNFLLQQNITMKEGRETEKLSSKRLITDIEDKGEDKQTKLV